MDISVNARETVYTELKQLGFYGVDVSFGKFYEREKLLSKEFENFISEKYQRIISCGLKVCQTHLTYYPGHLEPIGDGTYKAFEDYILPNYTLEDNLEKGNHKVKIKVSANKEEQSEGYYLRIIAFLVEKS